MKCPICPDQTLQMTERSGVEIDYCPNCRGVWLDRGELDKIVERSASEGAPKDERRNDRGDDRRDDDRHERWPADRGYEDGKGKKRKRESFLGDLFDF